LKRHIERKHSEKPRKYIVHEKKDQLFVCKICQEEFRYRMDVKTHYIKSHLPGELAEKGISMKTLVKRRKKRELKLAHKS
jgi:hypothetical protein